MQRDMRNQEKKAQIEEDNIFHQMTIEKDARAEEERRIRHKMKMDQYLGDYDNQKGVIVSFCFLILFCRGWLFTSNFCKNRS